MKIGPIEKGIPLPPSRDKYNFGDLRAGDSIMFSEINAGTQQRIRIAAHAYAKKHDWKIATRQEGKGALRVWRLA